VGTAVGADGGQLARPRAVQQEGAALVVDHLFHDDSLPDLKADPEPVDTGDVTAEPSRPQVVDPGRGRVALG
jgi:hypothetical protein